jgi:hypothetical protein
MFGLSTRATYRPLSDSDTRLSGRSPAFRGAYAHIAEACVRLSPMPRAAPCRVFASITRTVGRENGVRCCANHD